MHLKWIEIGLPAGLLDTEYRWPAVMVVGSKGYDDDSFDEGQ